MLIKNRKERYDIFLNIESCIMQLQRSMHPRREYLDSRNRTGARDSEICSRLAKLLALRHVYRRDVREYT